jgi:uncharacterized membrane protein YdfJ with MMPL/SSD domain
LKAVVLNMASVAATFGGLVLFWQHGYGSEQVYGVEGTGAINFWLPLMVFAFLYGLSMDYEVFILAASGRSTTGPGGRTRPSSRASAGPAGWSPRPR